MLSRNVVSISLCLFILVVIDSWLTFVEIKHPIVLFRYNERRYLIDVTEVFRGISFEKKFRFTKLGFYIFLFIMVVFR